MTKKMEIVGLEEILRQAARRLRQQTADPTEKKFFGTFLWPLEPGDGTSVTVAAYWRLSTDLLVEAAKISMATYLRATEAPAKGIAKTAKLPKAGSAKGKTSAKKQAPTKPVPSRSAKAPRTGK